MNFPVFSHSFCFPASLELQDFHPPSSKLLHPAISVFISEPIKCLLSLLRSSVDPQLSFHFFWNWCTIRSIVLSLSPVLFRSQFMPSTAKIAFNLAVFSLVILSIYSCLHTKICLQTRSNEVILKEWKWKKKEKCVKRNSKRNVCFFFARGEAIDRVGGCRSISRSITCVNSLRLTSDFLGSAHRFGVHCAIPTYSAAFLSKYIAIIYAKS